MLTAFPVTGVAAVIAGVIISVIVKTVPAIVERRAPEPAAMVMVVTMTAPVTSASIVTAPMASAAAMTAPMAVVMTAPNQFD